MDLIKIGGSVLKNKQGFFSMVDILNNHSKRPLCIVISAFSKATTELKKAARTAETGNEKVALKIIDKIILEHSEFASDILNNKSNLKRLANVLQKTSKKLSDYMKGLSITQELTLRTLDAVLSFGEYLALNIVNHFLKEQGFKIYCVDSTSIIVSDDNYGKAKPILKETSKKVKEKIINKINNNTILLTQGFVAKSRNGEYTTMGMESSNLTAVLLADILNVKTITLWTDVLGIRSADPKIITNTIPIKRLNSMQAYILGFNGLKLIYPEMIEYTVRKNISLIYKSAFKPDSESTYIDKNFNENKIPVIVSMTNLNFGIIYFSSVSDKEKIERKILQLKNLYNDIISYHVNSETIQILFRENNKIINHISKSVYSFEFFKCSVISILFAVDSFPDLVNRTIIRKFEGKIIQLISTKGNTKFIVSPEITNDLITEIHRILF
jgi:aspartate kinase